MKISTIYLTWAIGLAMLMGAVQTAQAGPTTISPNPTATPQNDPPQNTPSTATPAPVMIPVPAPQQSTIPAGSGNTVPDSTVTTPKSPAEIVALARSWKGTPYRYAGDSRRGIDCSHFVFEIYRQVVPGFGYRMAREYWSDPKFVTVTDPQPGDIIVFPSYRGSSDHVGIVTDARTKMFIGAQTSTGVAETGYGPNTYYWGKRPYKIVRMK
jgi:cell wall-associated NlpC family hydrolase